MKSYYYQVLGKKAVSENGDLPMIAASVIKIPIMVECFYQIHEGILEQDQLYTLKNNDKMPSCGALNRMHEGLQVTILDLIELMIILSDNTATNILIQIVGKENINHRMQSLGLMNIQLNRLLFDHSIPGVENYITANDIGKLLEMMTCDQLPYSNKMIDILMNQRLNGKIPFYLHSLGIKVAHKTGEDTRITHDVGIIYTKQPFILCMLCNDEDVPAYEREIQQKAYELAMNNN